MICCLRTLQESLRRGLKDYKERNEIMDHDKTKEMEDFSRAVKEFREARRMTDEQSPANETDSQAENTYQEE